MQACYKTVEDWTLAEIGGIHVLVQLSDQFASSSRLFELDDSMAFLWHMLEKGCSKEELVSEFDRHFSETEQPVEQIITQSLEMFTQKGLVELI